jgi:Cu/Ag efflux protein CusF/uncharacterized cupredoxin-like copper-binding protein
VFDPSIFHAGPATPSRTADRRLQQGDPPATSSSGPTYPVRRAPAAARPDTELAEHKILATSCARPRGFRRIQMKEGAQYAEPGGVYGFAPRIIHAERCEEIEVVLENSDSVRHDVMIPGLNPMFMLDFAGPATRTARFVTPDQDVMLDFHCHVPTHEAMGMRGQLIVGKGGAPQPETAAASGHLHVGEGLVVSIDPRKGRMVVDHKEIPGFMAPMVMNYLVNPPTLLEGLKPGEKIRFAIDEDQRAIVRVTPLKD